MCQSKADGGMRCAPHIKEDLDKAQAAYDAEPTDENKARLDKFKYDFNRTPKVIKSFRAKAQEQREAGNLKQAEEIEKLADGFEQDRKDMIAASRKKVADEKQKEEEARKAREEMKARITNFLASLIPAALDRLKTQWDKFAAGAINADSDPAYVSELATKLAADKSPTVRAKIAGNKYVPSEILASLADDPNPTVRQGLSMNPNTPPEVLTRLSNDDNPNVSRTVVHNPSTPPEVLAGFYVGAQDDALRLEGLAANPNTPPEIIAKMSARKPSVTARENMAANPNTPVAVLKKLGVVNAQPRIRAALATNPNTPPNILTRFGKDKDPLVREALVFNESTPSETLAKLAREDNPTMKFFICEHPNTYQHTIGELTKDKDKGVRTRAKQFFAEGQSMFQRNRNLYP